jgi:1-acyl-sn-glycerol-3-phosphate acyltransferase
MLYLLGKIIFFIIFKLFFKLTVYGKEYIPKKGGFIIASNHTSNLDPIVLGLASPRKINFMAKEELFKNKFFSFILHSVAAFPVKRNKVETTSIKEAIRRLKAGGGLLLFPEGGRRNFIDVSEIKAGVGLLSCKAKVPIIPTLIKGSGEVLPKGRYFPKRGKISVYFAPPISSYSQNYEDIARETMLAIKKLDAR